MMVRHTCDNPPCCNPNHLVAGTAAENSADMVARGRHWTQVRPERIPRGEDHWTRRLGTESFPRGEAHHNAKLNYDIADEIRRRVAAGEPKRAVARSLGISQGTVQSVTKGVRWVRPEDQ